MNCHDAEIDRLDEISRMNADELIRQRREVEAERDRLTARIQTLTDALDWISATTQEPETRDRCEEALNAK